MAQMFGQFQQLGQHLVNQQQVFQQSLEMQRQQSQVQMETLTNLGAAQVAKTTYDASDFQTKAFSKMKGFKGDEKTWLDWRYKFRVECFRPAAAILDGAEDGYDQPMSESDIQQIALRENWVDMANFNMQLQSDLVSLMEEFHATHCETCSSRATTNWSFERGCKHERLEQELRVVRQR